MKRIYYAHYDETTGRILGFYTPDVHGDMIPTPNIELTEEQWQSALGGRWMVADGALVEMPPYVPTLEELKEQKLSEIAYARWMEETSGIKIEEMRINTDDRSQRLITGAALQASLNPDYVCKWKTMDGFVTLTAQQILAVSEAVRVHIQNCFDHEAELITEITNAKSKEELEAIVWRA